jgi:hypothetical protein
MRQGEFGNSIGPNKATEIARSRMMSPMTPLGLLNIDFQNCFMW